MNNSPFQRSTFDVKKCLYGSSLGDEETIKIEVVTLSQYCIDISIDDVTMHPSFSPLLSFEENVSKIGYKIPTITTEFVKFFNDKILIGIDVPSITDENISQALRLLMRTPIPSNYIQRLQ